ncbi:MAG: hypothetical protein Q7S32_01715 [bacterium]|nr:hypothetical protein [bacterium]
MLTLALGLIVGAMLGTIVYTSAEKSPYSYMYPEEVAADKAIYFGIPFLGCTLISFFIAVILADDMPRIWKYEDLGNTELVAVHNAAYTEGSYFLF